MKEFWSDSKTVAARGFHICLAIMEMHSPKLVSLAIFYVCVWRVSVINVVLLLVTVITLPWPLVSCCPFNTPYLSLSFIKVACFTPYVHDSVLRCQGGGSLGSQLTNTSCPPRCSTS